MTFQHSKTSNGISVVTYFMPHINSVSTNIFVKVGSRYESLEESGISHFLEHMAFKGTSNRTTQDIAREFDTIGGHFNAYTSKENTVYYTKVLAQHLPQTLVILADILQNSLFTDSDIQKELGVIIQEIAEVQDNPDDMVHEIFYTLAYHDHPLGRPITGHVENIAKFNTASFQNYIKKHYTTDNIVISLAGNVQHLNAVNLIESLFFAIPVGVKQQYSPAQYTGGYHFLEKDLEQTTIALGFEGLSYTKVELFYHAQILSLIFGGSLSSRLFQKIREELGLAYSVGSGLHSYSDTGIFSIHASTKHSKAPELLQNIFAEIKKIQSNISIEELNIAKSQIKSNIYMAEEKPEYKSETIGRTYSLFGRYFSAEEIMQIINATTIADLHAIAERVFATNYTLSAIGLPSSTSLADYIP